MSLANDFGEIEGQYPVVVIGSGYGASVCAAQVAVHTKVCVLERGREYASGDFPADGSALLREAQFDDVLGHQGSPLALFDMHLNRDVDVLVGCGLGGTSLINGGIAIEPDPAVLEQSPWPSELRGGALRPYMDRARSVLRPSRYPESWPVPAKLAALQRAAAATTLPFSRAPVNVHFGPDGVTSSGVFQKACIGCGDCVTGCNFDAKNTLPYTYLPLAKQRGAHIFTQCEVLTIARDSGAYLLRFRRLDTNPSQPPVERQVRAQAVVVGAGALGSTALLLGSQSSDLAFSPRLGLGFSTNGDAISAGYNCDAATDAIGFGDSAMAGKPPPSTPVGPTLLGIVDLRAGALSQAILVEEGAFPSSLARLTAPLLQLLAGAASESTVGIAHWLRERQREAFDLAGDLRDGALNHSMIYLSMGHDGSAGRLYLDGDRVRVDWPTLKDAACFARANTVTTQLTATLGGLQVPNPGMSIPLVGRLTTVHPLGGCGMGTCADDGVVDHLGRVFDRASGGLHPRLYVADGSVIPTSLGANPLLTITAIAERIAEGIVAELTGATAS
jgi:cholesterol oxidase